MESYTNRLAVTSTLLRSQIPSDVHKGIDILFKILETNPEEKELIQFIINTATESPETMPYIIDMLNRLLAVHDSQIAKQTLIELQSRSGFYLDRLMLDADDAYYAAEYEKAVQLYQTALTLDPELERAKEQLAKVMGQRNSVEFYRKLPRVAVQYYRRARS